MILVFAEARGEKLLGKAREIADLLGVSVVAVCSQDTPAEKLISLGADEARIFEGAQSINDWAKVFAYLIRNDPKKIKIVLFASNTIGNAIMASTFALCYEQVGAFADELEHLDIDGATRTMHPSGCVLKTRSVEGKVSLWSVKLNSVAEPFEDSSRYGKVNNLKFPKESSDTCASPSAKKGNLDEEKKNEKTITFLIGRECQSELVEELAKKYSGKTVKMSSGPVEAISSPCFAIDVIAPVRELPDFYSEVLALNSSKNDSPITRIAKFYAVTKDPEQVLSELLKS